VEENCTILNRHTHLEKRAWKERDRGGKFGNLLPAPMHEEKLNVMEEESNGKKKSVALIHQLPWVRRLRTAGSKKRDR